MLGEAVSDGACLHALRRSPARPRAPRVEESDFVVEYQNEAAAAQAATKQQAAVPVVAAAAPGAQVGPGWRAEWGSEDSCG